MNALGLSVLIPARNEEFLAKTIEDILANMRGDTEVIAVLDGAWADPPIPDHPRVHLIYHSTSIGQRAATNEAARFSKAKYIMKCDAHCAFDEGFDVKLMEPYETGELAGNVTTVPRMYNLHVFDWACKACGHHSYQGPMPGSCEKCKANKGFDRVTIWKPRFTRKTDFARFDNTLHFQYWGACGKRPESQADIADLMCCVGACWMMPRARYWELGGMDEQHGSWGQMGVELACKSWLSGGRQIVNKRTWFSHLFRTQQGFGFPYPQSGRQVENARKYSRDIWQNNKWPKAVHKFQWLLDKFAPIPDWPEAPSKPAKSSIGLIYYTDHNAPAPIAEAVRARLLALCNGHQLISVGLKKPIPSFGHNLTFDMERGHLAMFKQILAGLEASDADIIFLVEHDVLYHPSHFDFRPPSREVYFYNEHTYKVDAKTGQAVFYYCKQTSGLCAYRELLLEHYRRRVEKVERDGYSRNMGFEPGCHQYPRGVDNYKAERWMSRFPNVDVRTGKNWTKTRWDPSEFRNKNSCLGWTLVDEIPGWGVTKGRFDDFLKETCEVIRGRVFIQEKRLHEHRS